MHMVGFAVCLFLLLFIHPFIVHAQRPTSGIKAWQRSLYETVPAIEKPLTVLPTEFSFAQDYPDHFHPMTTIYHELTKSANVSLRNFNTPG
jgi:hypothetical protein